MTDVSDKVEEKEPFEFSFTLGPSNASKGEGVVVDPFMKDNINRLRGLTPTAKRRISNNLQKVNKGTGGARSQSKDPEELYSGYDALGVVQPPYNLDNLVRLNGLSAPHYAAIKAKVSNIVGLGYNLMETPRTKLAMEDMEDAQLEKFRKKLRKEKIRVAEWISGWNDDDSIVEVLKNVWMDYETTGNGYIEVSRVKAGPRAGSIGYVGHIPATTLRIRRERDGFVQIVGDKATFFRNFGEEAPNPIGGDSRPNEIIHIKKYAPGSGYYGIPDIIAAMPALTGSELASRYNLDYFENKAVPRHVIVLKGGTLNALAQLRLVEFFETSLKGKNHRTLIVPLPADTPDQKVSFDMKPVESGTQDQSFEKYDNTNTDKILMVHGVPRTKVSVAGGTNLAIARDADKTFKEQICAPEQKKAEKKVNKLLSEFTDVFQIKFNEMTLTDEDTKSKIHERYRKMGATTGNEVRADIDLPGRDDGEDLFDLNKTASQASADATTNRQRDGQRTANATDSRGEGRNPKGEGRTEGTS